MSEPVIKPFMVTMERGDDGKVSWREHFTRDDLVRAVAEALQHYEVFSYSEMVAQLFVDMLTKGDV